LLTAAAGCNDRRLVHQIGKIGTSEPGRHGGDAIEIAFWIEDDFFSHAPLRFPAQLDTGRDESGLHG
jgi:hypothetical protein